MKRIFSILMLAVMVLSFASCNNTNERAERYCQYCGQGVSVTAFFCEHCGSNLETNQTEVSKDETEVTVETISNEDIWNFAKEITAEQLWNNIGHNAAKAETYVGQTLKITGTVIEIEKDSCYIMSRKNKNTSITHFENDAEFDCEFGIRVYLEANELANLNICDVITFAGVVDSTGNENYGIAKPIVLYFKNAITNNK